MVENTEQTYPMETVDNVQRWIAAGKKLTPLVIAAIELFNQYKKPEYIDYDGSFTDLSEIAAYSEDGVTIRWASNDSCNCHPEWHTHERFLSWDMVFNPDAWVKSEEEKEAKRKEEAKKTLEQAAKRKKERDEQKEREKIEAEKAELERLKAKYETV